MTITFLGFRAICKSGPFMVMTPAININDACDYIIRSMNEAGESPSVLKMQKLLYYCQAWHLAICKVPLFRGEFQAWVRGPVSREVYDRFITKTMFAPLGEADIRPEFANAEIPEDARKLVDQVLETYGKYSDTQLAELTHRERPWTEARDGIAPQARCTVVISEATMQETYAARIPS
jgi:uncharacterized phage-associated protein